VGEPDNNLSINQSKQINVAPSVVEKRIKSSFELEKSQSTNAKDNY